MDRDEHRTMSSSKRVKKTRRPIITDAFRNKNAKDLQKVLFCYISVQKNKEMMSPLLGIDLIICQEE